MESSTESNEQPKVTDWEEVKRLKEEFLELEATTNQLHTEAQAAHILAIEANKLSREAERAVLRAVFPNKDIP